MHEFALAGKSAKLKYYCCPSCKEVNCRYFIKMPLTILHHREFQADIGEGHRFPMGKYGLIARYLVDDGLIKPDNLIIPEPVEFDQATHAHDPHYVRMVFQADLAPNIAKDIGFSVNESVARRARLSSGATLLAGKLALERGIATSTAGGSHHARRSQGAGFCVFNDVAIAATNILAAGEARRIMVFDCDVHQGDGTADIFRNDPRVTTISIHNERNYPARKVASDLDVGLDDGLEDDAYLECIRDVLARLEGFAKPDLVFYNAGVDPHKNDRLGRLALTDEGLGERDRRVIGYFRDRTIPLAAVQGGGYSNNVEEVARRHTIIHHVAAEFC